MPCLYCCHCLSCRLQAALQHSSCTTSLCHLHSVQLWSSYRRKELIIGPMSACSAPVEAASVQVYDSVCACAAQCQTYAQSLATDCSQFLGTVQSSSNLNGASDAQLQAAIGNNKPSPTCCGTIQKTLSNVRLHLTWSSTTLM